MTTKIIAIANQKGGVGKTTTAVNLATAIAATGKRVLLIDLDPQGNASTGFGLDRRETTIYDVVIGNQAITEAIQQSNIDGLDVITSTVDLSAAELELNDVDAREHALKQQLEPTEGVYDYVFIDCPPSLGLLTVNALVAAHSVMIPLQCEFFALEGLSHLLKTITMVKKNLNPDLDIQGIVLTMYDKRNNLSHQVAQDVKTHLGNDVYQTMIPRNIRLSEAPSHGLPALLYDHKCPGSLAYILLAKEMLQREQLSA